MRKGVERRHYLPTTRAASAVVPDSREQLSEHASAKAESVWRKAEEITFFMSIGKSTSCNMYFSKLLHAKSAACFPPCPSNTYTLH